MKKRIAVVASEKEYADFLKNNVEKYLGKYATFTSYSMIEMNEKGELDEDFVLISAFNIFQAVRSSVSEKSEIVVLSLALNKKQMESINMVPKGTKALLVNFDNRSCMHTITSLYDAGYRDVELIPYYGEGQPDPDIKLAITPNEAHLVPKSIETIINVGESSVSMNSLYEIAEKLGVYEEFSENEADEARQEYYYINSGLDRLMAEKISVKDKLSAVIRLMKDGIVITDIYGKIYLSNDKANTMLQHNEGDLSGAYIEKLLPEINFDLKKEKLIRAEGRNVIAETVEIISQKQVVGYIVTLEDFEEVEEKQHGIRAKIAGGNHSAKYTFTDIIGHSDSIKKCIDEAKRFAISDSSVLITGESGTGKEMFAQSIHNESDRRRYNFVAVNCAAIPENLLESEMFGYEEGSFTGAKKGGKPGLFELAHRGTIFLDEIGEMPLQLQSKLLRALEEKEIRRVGSERNISIDVRVIAATNKNIRKLIADGEFREDLFYRLNVLPLDVPSLNQRKEDIKEIFYHLVHEMGGDLTLADNAKTVMEKYTWPGNVRELKNMAEYLVNQNKKVIEADDIRFLNMEPVLDMKIDEYMGDILNNNSEMVGFIFREGAGINLIYDICSVLVNMKRRHERCGRKKLQSYLEDAGNYYSEGEIRGALSKMSQTGYVHTLKGRGGSEITGKGVELFKLIGELKSKGVLGY